MNDIGPTVDPPWWNFARQVVMFMLGIAMIIWWVIERDANKFALFQLLTGLILIGLVPIDRLLGRVGINVAPSQQPPVPNPPSQP